MYFLQDVHDCCTFASAFGLKTAVGARFRSLEWLHEDREVVRGSRLRRPFAGGVRGEENQGEVRQPVRVPVGRSRCSLGSTKKERPGQEMSARRPLGVFCARRRYNSFYTMESLILAQDER